MSEKTNIATLDYLNEYDPAIGNAMTDELKRQRRNLELIASENIVSPAVMAAMGSLLTNKYAEGYPGKRYYGGCQCVDVVEEIARQRACELFGAEHANVQPHSGAQANTAVYFAMLNPGDTVMGMNLNEGGHLTHGSPVNISGKYFNSGVMFINIEKWVNENIFEKFMVLINDRIFKYPDQDALNILFKNKVLYISSSFNHFKEKNSCQANLIHYVGWLKPWSMAADNNEKYLEYYRKSPFNEIPLQNPNTYKLAKMLAKKYKINKRYSDYVKWYFIYIFMKTKYKFK